ncbi:MAG: bifunctional diaminohydroxyphosphoribosylaminopyrimidine deaminase/5-amino-6-(5-phosphoribosylamino)uracil reductase RibD [Deltaproteobacteria bacterium]|nr:bifunctional diaminohydroxyphosphoribosylaminopyrimidine deaminase/5-amino-6-(5-phosphoribosylamino)uracil reductase RibD [Deltaproteobacteria bacterium]
MKMALRLAVRAKGRTSPNPLVGALIVKDGAVIGRGYHKKAGTPHAEVNAIADAGGLARGATIYVTLEPCNHQGRTPPCTRAIMESGLARVVIGMADPNPLVAGGGSGYLASQGLDVVNGVLEDKCRRINRPFSKWATTGRPWVIMKAGLSLDGRMAAGSGKPDWISNEKSRRYSHVLRDRADGILVGIGTVLADNPSLTTRLPGLSHSDPTRIVLDTKLRMPPTAKMLTLNSGAETIVFCAADAPPDKKKALQRAGAVPVPVKIADNGRLDLEDILSELGKRQISSVLVEGGSKVHTSFLDRGLVDQVNLFYGPFFIGGDGIPVAGTLGLDVVEQAPRLKDVSSRRFGDDVMIEGYF